MDRLQHIPPGVDRAVAPLGRCALAEYHVIVGSTLFRVVTRHTPIPPLPLTGLMIRGRVSSPITRSIQCCLSIVGCQEPRLLKSRVRCSQHPSLHCFVRNLICCEMETVTFQTARQCVGSIDTSVYAENYGADGHSSDAEATYQGLWDHRCGNSR